MKRGMYAFWKSPSFFLFMETMKNRYIASHYFHDFRQYIQPSYDKQLKRGSVVIERANMINGMKNKIVKNTCSP